MSSVWLHLYSSAVVKRANTVNAGIVPTTWIDFCVCTFPDLFC